jgi:hypothetical protein
MEPLGYGRLWGGAEPENDDVYEVVCAWADKFKRLPTCIPPRDIDSWSKSVAMHGKNWCLSAIKNAHSVYAGVVICEAEKADREATGKSGLVDKLKGWMK